ncbi:MAG TPA: class E sortase [Gaiellaceae bacterium]|jgi:sortase A|nr:class E sortase [Gaiellaceae bacterium]
MRRGLRITGTVLAVAGALTLVWALVVWLWQDPFTALYTKWKQHELAGQYENRAAGFRVEIPAGVSLAVERRTVAVAARRYRTTTHRGEAIGRITVPRMGLNMVLVDGTDHESLKKGPGRDLRTFMPGENRLVYIAGHRTTYLAPFSHIDSLRKRDRVTIEVPYATFVYNVTGHRIVPANDLAVLRSPRHELLELQACHPRFFATHRYIAYARLVRVEPRGGTPYNLAAAAQTSGK